MGGREIIDEGAGIRWLTEELEPWDRWPMPIASLVTRRFDAHARVLHPGWSQPDGARVPWREVAAWSGTQLEPTSYFLDIATREDGTRWSGVGMPPLPGELPEEEFRTLVDDLAPRTSTPETGWALVWEGLGIVRDHFHGHSAFGIRDDIEGSGRSYYLVGGPIASFLELLRFDGWFQTPSWWWPEDRAWLVATEIDAQSTYVAGSPDTIEAILAEERLEAVPAAPDYLLDGTHQGQTVWRR